MLWVYGSRKTHLLGADFFLTLFDGHTETAESCVWMVLKCRDHCCPNGIINGICIKYVSRQIPSCPVSRMGRYYRTSMNLKCLPRTNRTPTLTDHSCHGNITIETSVTTPLLIGGHGILNTIKTAVVIYPNITWQILWHLQIKYKKHILCDVDIMTNGGYASRMNQ